MYNIKQITNFDIDSYPTEEIDVTVAGMSTPRTVIYKIIDNGYISQGIEKFGYCCEPKAISYPIWLVLREGNNLNTKSFEVGKTGMFEVQPENWTNVNDPTAEEETMTVDVVEIKVPWQWKKDPNPGPHGFNFKLDYVN